MKQSWTLSELKEQWSLTPVELELTAGRTGVNQLGFAVLLKFFQLEGKFPENFRDIPKQVLNYLARFLKLKGSSLSSYNFKGRSSKRHRTEIRAFAGFREATLSDARLAQSWMLESIITGEHSEQFLLETLQAWFKEQSIEPPTLERQKRLLKAALRRYEATFFRSISKQLSTESKQNLEEFLFPSFEDPEGVNFNALKEDPGRVGMDSFLFELDKLKRIETLKLPSHIFNEFSPKFLTPYRNRVTTESIRDIRRHPEAIRHTLVALFCWQRQREITDNLIDLLIQIIHQIHARAERKIIQKLIKEIHKTHGKDALLYKLAEASLDKPDGLVREVVYPIAGEQTLQDIVNEYKNKGPAYHRHIHMRARGSYKNHYRRMLPRVLNALQFHSNNTHYQPLIEALDYLKNPEKTSQRFIPFEAVPFNTVIPKKLRACIVEKDSKGKKKINRISYEMVILQGLRDRLRCKEVWVEGANRYRNPDEDLPSDFEEKREVYYKNLKLSLDADVFTHKIQQDMQAGLASLNKTLPTNSHVLLRKNGKKRICLSPLKAQAEPIFLSRLKTEMMKRWPLTSLLDILKETNLRVGFTEFFKGMGNREIFAREDLEKRLLLCLYGLGTNTGLKRVLSGGFDYSYDDLLYVKRRYLHKESLRDSIATVANAIFQIRQSHIWGEGTTACASDSKKFGAWDQNLMTEWHVRYGGRGIMIYWHVEKKSVCIYSQLKRCSSSEVASMVEGVLRHCTEMTITKQYVDSHGQSEVAFAFCHMLGFDLMPRLKAIASQKLYRPYPAEQVSYLNLQPILTRAINWELIRQHYDQIVKYVTALKLGTAESEAILRRFTRNNLKHPTYQALAELGKAIKTIFLCRYLSSLALRREIHEALNVVENWNSANNFIFFAKNSEISSNQLAEQELSILSLHLLQICLVYINTLMIQNILSALDWFERMTVEDFRALTPLIYVHVTPYGLFDLDMNRRLSIEVRKAA